MAVNRPVRLRGCLLGVLSFINSMRSIPLKGWQAEQRWKTENLCSETARKRLLRRLLYKSRGILFLSFRVYSGGSRPSDKETGGGGGEGTPKNFFSAFRASVWSKDKGGGRPPRAPPMEPPLVYNRCITRCALHLAFLNQSYITWCRCLWFTASFLNISEKTFSSRDSKRKLKGTSGSFSVALAQSHLKWRESGTNPWKTRENPVNHL